MCISPESRGSVQVNYFAELFPWRMDGEGGQVSTLHIIGGSIFCRVETCLSEQTVDWFPLGLQLAIGERETCRA